MNAKNQESSKASEAVKLEDIDATPGVEYDISFIGGAACSLHKPQVDVDQEKNHEEKPEESPRAKSLDGAILCRQLEQIESLAAELQKKLFKVHLNKHQFAVVEHDAANIKLILSAMLENHFSEYNFNITDVIGSPSR